MKIFLILSLILFTGCGEDPAFKCETSEKIECTSLAEGECHSCTYYREKSENNWQREMICELPTSAPCEECYTTISRDCYE